MFDSEKLSFPLLNLVRLPDITIDNKTKKKFGVHIDANNAVFLRTISQAALDKLTANFNSKEKKVYQDRLDFELSLVEELSFTDYFLLVWKVINKMIDIGAFRDMGRGSAAGSLVFYALGITGVDPIKYNLLFARFISKVRAKKQVIDGVTYLQGDLAPDVDLNLGGARDEIIEWLNKEYQGRVCPISTFGTLTGKSLVKDVYKTLEDVPEAEANRVSNLIDKHFGIVEDIEKMPEKNKDFKVWSETHKRTYQVALQLRDLVKNKGSHASGYFISCDLLAENFPLDLNKDKEPILTFEMKAASKLGIKLDCLGLTTNQIIQEVLSGVPEKIEDIMTKLYDDGIIYDQYQHGTLLPYGLYQISADCAYGALIKIKPKNLDELSDLNSIARPGALAYLDGYVKNANESPHPAFKDILGSTRNYCLYQEQMIQMAVALGFTPEEGELIRRVVGKKLVEEVKSWKDKIYQKCKDNGFSPEIGDLYWKIIDDSSKYSFNKCLFPEEEVQTLNGIKKLKDVRIGEKIACYNNEKVFHEIKDIIHGKAELYEFELSDGRTIRCSMEHKFLTNRGMITIKDIIINGLEIIAEEEVFKDVVGYEGFYKVSNYGTVISSRATTNTYYGRVLKPEVDKDGYLKVPLKKQGKQKKFFIHRLVLCAFSPANGKDDSTVNHKDGVKNNNKLTNLEWASYSHNNSHAFNSGLRSIDYCAGENSRFCKLTKNQVLEIRKLANETTLTHLEIARRFNTSRTNVGAIVNRYNWKQI